MDSNIVFYCEVSPLRSRRKRDTNRWANGPAGCLLAKQGMYHVGV